MKYTIQVNQAGADAAKLRGKVDIVDLAIFDAFRDFANGTKCEKKMTADGRVWFWVSYTLIIEELPYCNIRTTDGVYRRMKNLQSAGIIDFHPDNQRTNKTFFAWGKAYDLLISDTDLRMKNRRGTDEKPEGYGLKTGGGTDEKPDNHYTNNHATKSEEKKGATLSSTSEPENISLEAERKKEIPPNSAAPPLVPPFTPTGEHIAPQPAKVITLYEKGLPGVTVVDSVPGTYTPNTEFRRVNIPEEIERLKTDPAAKETFALVRKIPSNLYPDYVEAFEKEIGGTGETYHNLPAFRKHFFNWCGSRWEIAQRKATGTKPTRSTIQTFRGTDYGNEKQAF